LATNPSYLRLYHTNLNRFARKYWFPQPKNEVWTRFIPGVNQVHTGVNPVMPREITRGSAYNHPLFGTTSKTPICSMVFANFWNLTWYSCSPYRWDQGWGGKSRETQSVTREQAKQLAISVIFEISWPFPYSARMFF
jgi:hypothetical protein